MEINLSKDISHYKKFFREGIFLDTGSLMLLFYGEYDRLNNSNYLKDIGYDKNHFEALTRFIMGSPTKKGNRLRLIITPHIFTEFYKHVERDFDKKTNFKRFFKQSTDQLLNIEQQEVCKNKLLKSDKFVRLEIGEVSLFCLCEPYKHDKFHVIIHHDGGIDRELEKDKNILTIHDINHIHSWYLTQSI